MQVCMHKNCPSDFDISNRTLEILKLATQDPVSNPRSPTNDLNNGLCWYLPLWRDSDLVRDSIGSKDRVMNEMC
jgi:hypothetical protein